ncbi:Alpha/beta hydrolase fold-1 [Rhodocollybia butyracea]|uniref:Alpha/beta hydrolase fold-1 n=1 Tax=Rhodocollybia butyracea TaxID=206335 RepID=A0A9P5PRZ8_9AGAR|nr:Alpha/beta hydrolase fold-1 [Rhodocollybia butyracea]
MSSSLLSESYTWDPRPYYPLVSAIKRYWKPSWKDGLTLVFTHGTGFGKEHWEPTIDDLVDIIEQQSSKIKIREIWSIDAPNHGDSAILNEEKLQWGYEPTFQWGEYGRSIHSFLTGRGRTLLGSTLEGKVVGNFDFSSHTLVGIGHSVGAVALLLGLDFAPSIESLFASMICVEPMIMDPSVILTTNSGKLAQASDSRRDIWPSREDAYKTLKARKMWKVWDDRVLKIFVETGLRPLPTLDYPDIKEGVTLKCSRKQEAAVYRDSHGYSTVYRGFRCYASRVRIHLCYGTIHDYIPAENIEDVLKNAIGGTQNLASFGYIEGVGHTAPHQNPRKVAEKILECLNVDARALGSKL